MKDRILLVGDYNRTDFLLFAKLLHKEIDFYFIEFLNKRELTNSECLKYGKVLYWKNYKSAYQLLDVLQPSKIVFYFIESFNHVALNVACKVKGVPTYHLEHGLRFTLAFYKSFNKSIAKPTKETSFVNRLSVLRDIYDKFRNRQFFQKTVSESPAKESNFLNDFFKVRKENGVFDTFQLVKNNLRLPDQYISFSPLIFNFHKELENLSDSYPVHFIGIPQFDHFAALKQLAGKGENLLFIDQPLHEQAVYGWTSIEKQKLLKGLLQIAIHLKKKLYIKPHPLNDLSAYNEINDNACVAIIEGQWDEVIKEVNTVLGFSSTLLLPFIAMHSINCYLLEMHPERGEEPYSQFLLNSGACHAAFSFEDLEEKMKNWNDWNVEQMQYKDQFIQDYMYKFDGKSSDRLKSILLSEAS